MAISRPPNVLVILTDQQRHDTTGVHGCRLGLTPHFDDLAAHGTHLAKSFTCQPVCAPARSCLQVGRYATSTGVWCNGGTLRAGDKTLADHFNAAGYHTGYIGKWHLAPNKYHGYVPREFQGGYQSWLGANILEFVSDAFSCRLWDEEGGEHRLPGYRVDAVTDAAIRHLDQRSRSRQPFFLFVSYLEPHHQNSRDDYPAPPGHELRYATAQMPPDLRVPQSTAGRHWPGYCGMIKRIDEGLGRILDALTSLGQRENTILLFTSDHGNHFKTRNGEYKRSCHDASIRVPTVFAGPGFDGGGTVRRLTSLVDLPATLLDAAGLPVPDDAQGRSLLPLLRGSQQPWPEEVLVQISESQTGRAVRTRRWKYSVRCPDKDAAGNPVSRASAETYMDDCLYDLQADPWEMTNLAGYTSHQQVVKIMRERLVRRMTAIGETAPKFLDAPPQAPYEHVVTEEDALS